MQGIVVENECGVADAKTAEKGKQIVGARVAGRTPDGRKAECHGCKSVGWTLENEDFARRRQKKRRRVKETLPGAADGPLATFQVAEADADDFAGSVAHGEGKGGVDVVIGGAEAVDGFH